MSQKQHYISRVLTKPWEDSDRMLWYFDCTDSTIKSSSSKDLFSEHNLWKEKLEKIFQKTERRITQDIQHLIDPDNNLSNEELSTVIRNLLMLHFYNAKRSMLVHWKSREIDNLTNLKANGRLEEVEIFAARYNFIRLPLNHKYKYYFPQTGFFRIPIFNNFTNEMDIGIAIPIHPQWAFAMIPKGYNPIHFNEMLKTSEHLLRDLSTGSRQDNKILIHPDCINMSNHQRLSEEIKKTREDSIEYFKKMILSSSSLFLRAGKRNP